MSVVERTLEEELEEELAKIDPETLRALLERFLQGEPEKLVELEEEIAKTDPALLLQNKPLLPTSFQPRRLPAEERREKCF